MTQASIQKDPGPDTFLGVLELIWTVSVYKDIMTVLKLGEQTAMNQNNLLVKREFMKLISLWKTILKSIVHKLRATKCEDLLWNAFKQILYDTGLYTTSLQYKMTDTTMNLFQDFASQQQVDPSDADSKVQFSECAITATTTSKSTIMHTRETPVVISESKKSETYAENLNLIAEYFGVQNAQRNTGSISQSISRQMNGMQYTLKPPGEYGLNIGELKMYPFAKVQHLDRKNWWKHAETKIIFLTNSPVDPVLMKNVSSLENVQ